jgi:hypothetical protein
MEDLLVSDTLSGYVNGAYTGADKAKGILLSSLRAYLTRDGGSVASPRPDDLSLSRPTFQPVAGNSSACQIRIFKLSGSAFQAVRSGFSS